MFGPHAAVDRIKEVMGAANLQSTAERKVKEKQERLAYGAQLQAQMLQQEDARKRERMERMGIQGPPVAGMPMAGAPPMNMNMNPMQPAPAPLPAMPQPPPQVPQSYSPAPPSYMPMQAQYASPGPASNPYAQQPPQYGAPSNPYSSPGMGMQPPGMQMGQQPPQLQMPGYNGSFGPTSPGSMGAMQMPGSVGAMGMMPPPPGAAPMMMMPRPPGPGPLQGGNPGQMAAEAAAARAADAARKNQYRAELEMQMRGNEERKRAEKEASMQEARARQAMAAAADYVQAMGRMGGPGPMMGGGGAPPPYMGGPGGMGGMGGAPQYMGGPPGGGYGPSSPTGGGGGGGGAFGDPPSPRGMGGMGGGQSPFMGGPPGQAPYGGGGPPPGMEPVFKFRSDHAYATPAEMGAKARQRHELQEALERQIAEKKYKKDMERAQEQEEMMREEKRLRSEQDKLRNNFAQEKARESGKEVSDEDKVAAAWAKAKEDAEAAKREKYARARGNRTSSDGQQMDQDTASGAPHAPFAPPQAQVETQPPIFAPGPAPVHMGPPSTPLVAEKVKQVAQQEIERVRAEMAAEAASLRSVVQEQSAQVAALKQHAERMEQQAESAQAQVNKMRIDMIRSSLAAPESMMRILSDYPMVPDAPPPPSMLDIALDLPEPAAVQRRAVQARGGPTMDMGPLIPPIHNPLHANPDVQASFLRTPGGHERPPTQGLRTINPLEASMAAESVFIYPGGREVPKNSVMRAMSPAALAASNLPFKSIVVPEGQSLASMGGAVSTSLDSPGALQGASKLLTPNGGAFSSSPTAGASNGAAMGRPNSGLLPPGTADAVARLQRELQAQADAAKAAALSAPTPMDMDNLMAQNQDKLNMLKELTALSATESAEAIDAFLAKFSRAQASLPERTRTPVLRVNTPQMPPASAYTASAGYNPQHASMARANSGQRPAPIPTAAPGVGYNSTGGAPPSPGNIPRASSLGQQPVRPGSGASQAGDRDTRPSQQPPRSPILFTDNNRAKSGTPPPATANSKPATPLLGEFLDPATLKDKQMLPGPGLARAPSHGRRASSATQPGPGSSSGAVPMGGGMQGAGSRPPSGLQAPAGIPPRAFSAGHAPPPFGGDAVDEFARQASQQSLGGGTSRPGSQHMYQQQQGMMGSSGLGGSRPPSNGSHAMLTRQWSQGSKQGQAGWGGAGQQNSRPPSGLQPADGALSGMPLPRSNSLERSGSRAGSAGRRTPQQTFGDHF